MGGKIAWKIDDLLSGKPLAEALIFYRNFRKAKTLGPLDFPRGISGKFEVGQPRKVLISVMASQMSVVSKMIFHCRNAGPKAFEKNRFGRSAAVTWGLHPTTKNKNNPLSTVMGGRWKIFLGGINNACCTCIRAGVAWSMANK